MKRTIVSIKSIADVRFLRQGFDHASKGNKAYRKDVMAYDAHLDENLQRLSEQLLAGTWQPSCGRQFDLFTEGKWRVITDYPVEDRIVHWCLAETFRFEQHFIRRTFGCIRKRGTLKASKQVRRDLFDSGYRYVVKLDVRKFYPSINRQCLMEMVRRDYKGEAAIRLFEKVIMSYMDGSPTGVSIGSYLSQSVGNFCLTRFDKFCLENIKLHYYTRFVDDIVVVVRSKEGCGNIIESMKQEAGKIGLVFGKIAVFDIGKRRCDFCGYAIDENGVKVRKSTRLHFSQKMRALQRLVDAGGKVKERDRSSICSYLGLMQHAREVQYIHQQNRIYHEVVKRINRHASCRRRKVRKTATA